MKSFLSVNKLRALNRRTETELGALNRVRKKPLLDFVTFPISFEELWEAHKVKNVNAVLH